MGDIRLVEFSKEKEELFIQMNQESFQKILWAMVAKECLNLKKYVLNELKKYL